MTHEQLIEKTKELIAIESIVSNKPALHDAVNLITDYITQFEGITIERFESNGSPSILAYAGKTRPETFDILFNGHLDVVPGRPEDFIPRLEDGKLYGRGVYDMKMAAWIMTDIFCQQANTAPIAMGLQLVTDEETGGYDGVRHQLAQGVRSKFTITGEMTDLEVCNESRGLCWVELAFHGTRAHGGHAWNGDNAVVKASNFAAAVLQKYPMPDKQTWTTTASIAAITTSNETYNQVPQEATLKIDFRFPAEDPVFTNRETVAAFIKSIDPTAEIIAMPVCETAVHVPSDNPDLKKFMHAYKNATGQNATLIQRHGGSDARHFASKDMQCIEFGLGGNNLHGDNEHAILETVAPYRAILESFIHEYTFTPTETRGHSNGHRAQIGK
jgi:succinyl-diaminopimelate desuccinylase